MKAEKNPKPQSTKIKTPPPKKSKRNKKTPNKQKTSKNPKPKPNPKYSSVANDFEVKCIQKARSKTCYSFLFHLTCCFPNTN